MLLSFSIHTNTVLSIIDSQVQQYVRQRHHKVFNCPSKSPATTKFKQFQNHQQESNNKGLINSTKTMNERYAFFNIFS